MSCFSRESSVEYPFFLSQMEEILTKIYMFVCLSICHSLIDNSRSVFIIIFPLKKKMLSASFHMFPKDFNLANKRA